MPGLPPFTEGDRTVEDDSQSRAKGGTRNAKPGTRNAKARPRNAKPGTRNAKTGTRNPAVPTRNPAAGTQNKRPWFGPRGLGMAIAPAAFIPRIITMIQQR